jgi:hypothetical protein
VRMPAVFFGHGSPMNALDLESISTTTVELG